MTAHNPDHGTTSNQQLDQASIRQPDRDHPTATGRLVGVGGRAHSAGGVGGVSAAGVAERAGERRARLLVELADAVRELVEPSTVTEYVDERVPASELVTRRGRRHKGEGRVRVRRAHHKRMPSLLDQLRYAEPPAAVDLGARGTWTKGFESKPPAELATLSVLGEINDGARAWARALGRPAKSTLEATLSSLVDATWRPDDLEMLTSTTRRWVRQAKNALRTEAPPLTLGDACPNCGRRNCLVVAGDLASARCGRCGREWAQDTIGLLANMLQANQEATTLAAADSADASVGRCWMADCVRTGDHAQHADHRGRTWGDTCAVTPR